MKAGLIWPRGRVHMSDKSNPVFQECCFFTGAFLPYRTIFCCSVVRSERVFFNNAHRFKHIALLKGMLYVNNTAHIAQKYWLFWGGRTDPSKGGSDIQKCTLYSFNGHGAAFQGILHILFGHCIAAKEYLLLSFRRVCLFWILHLLSGMGML